MCAINGFDFEDKGLIEKMNNITKHRGPDGTGVFVNENVSLGHNRLSILDLSENANQPMRSGCGRYVIVFNGEIYNFKELRNELRSGYDFKTNGDTEVIIAAYKKWKYECVKKFNGIFAFVILDIKDKELYLARDYVGVKPLYYFLEDNKFIFSSEIKAILEHKVPRCMDNDAFNRYFNALYVPEPLTMFKNIFKFPAANYAVYKKGDLKFRKYWQPGNKRNLVKTKSEIINEVARMVQKSVSNQLISDRPLGVFLSGGIDSSSVLHCMAQVKNNIDTFSVEYEIKNAEVRKKFNADFELAKKTASYYGANHNEILVSVDDIINNFEKCIWHQDEPISNPTQIPIYILAKYAKRKVDVALGGDGGDELFGGYDRYQLSYIANYYQKLPKVIREILNKKEKLRKLNTPKGVGRIALFMFQKEDVLSKVINKNYLSLMNLKDFFEKKYFANKTDLPFEELFMNVERETWLKDDSLVRTDKMSMASGLEVRVPLLDKDLVEYSTSIPLKYKLSTYDKKIVLKKAFKNKLPDFLFDQPKRGWISPGAMWLRHKRFNKMAREMLSKDYNKKTEALFNWENIHDLINSHCGGGEYHLTILWSLLTFQIWAKKFDVNI